MRVWTKAAIGMLLLCVMTPMAYAASIGDASALRVVATEATSVERVAYWRCWWSQGIRHCRRSRLRNYTYYGIPSNQGYSAGSRVVIIMGIQ
jgi:hypothetical protein